jgi:tetratricopeptide (TPR) repeat protein
VPSEAPRDRQKSDAEIRRILTETEVFLKYGLRAKAIEHLQRCFEIDPTNLEPRERLKALYLQAGQREEAIGVLFAIVDVLEGEPALAANYLDEIVRIDPNNRRARDRLTAMRGSGTRPATRTPAPADPFDEAGDPGSFEEPAVDLASDVAPVPDLLEEEYPMEASDEVVLDLAASDSEVTNPATDRRGAASAAARARSEDADLPPVLQSRAEHSPPPDNVIPFPSPRTREVPADIRPAQEAGGGAAPGIDVEENLEEADFFIAQGLHDEARALLTELLRAHPGHRVLLDKMAEVDELSGGAAASGDESFELAARLADELGEPSHAEPADFVNVDQVFEQFKRGVEQQVAADDWATHLDLGIAYKEMGLLDDAISEFGTAMSNPAKACQCHTLIGLCHMQKGQFADAIASFKKGLYVDRKTDLEELALYWELGNAHDKMQDTKEAIYYFQKVQKRDPSFRGVGQRIAALGAGQQAPTDDVDRAFDDLMKSTRK